MNGILYSIAMPIGNTDDLSLRARDLLLKANGIVCEDTRKTRSWLSRSQINFSGRFFVHNSVNAENSVKGIIPLLTSGQQLALVSDGGTPNFSDPGWQLLKACYEAKIRVIPVPGPNALVTLLSAVPVPSAPLLFLGFLSPKSARRRRILQEYSEFDGTIGLYESVHRVEALLEDILFCIPNCKIAIGRELTKEHEEIFIGDINQGLEWIPGKKGEFCILIHHSE